MQRECCSYDSFGVVHSSRVDPPPMMCDCKYGYKEKSQACRSEQTGCPKFRMVVALLNNMTDDEFYQILNRKFVEKKIIQQPKWCGNIYCDINCVGGECACAVDCHVPCSFIHTGVVCESCPEEYYEICPFREEENV